MLTFDHAFRNLLLKRICGLTNENLFAYEGLVALQIELIQALKVLEAETGDQQPDVDIRKKSEKEKQQQDDNPKAAQKARLRSQIERADQLAHDLIKPFEKEFNAVHDLWIARRRLALQQGNYFQFHLGWRKMICYCSAWLNYRKVQIGTAITFVPVRFSNGIATLRSVFSGGPRSKCGNPGRAANDNKNARDKQRPGKTPQH